MIGIIDYGMGNLRSVQKGLAKVGYEAEFVTEGSKLQNYDGIILPGVGAFADAMSNLHQMEMVTAIHNFVQTGRPFLGICLGLQVLFETGEEWGETAGLGLFPGKVRILPPGLKIPHMGWNQIEIKRKNDILQDVPDGSAFYFVHSYAVDTPNEEIIIASTDYGKEFPSIVGKGNVFGIQFHPEKSSQWGLKILQNFGRLVGKC